MLLVVSMIAAGCGQKGPPLPPIVRTPVAPVVTADRRGAVVELALTVPNANVDGSRPANLTHVDIYAVNGVALTMTDLEMMKRGTKVASVPVKAPRNADAAVEQGESADDAEPTVGDGLEQGSSSAIAETITPTLMASLTSRSDRRGKKEAPAPDGPLLGPAALSQLRTYIAVGVDRRGHPGQFSKRVAVPLELPPLLPPPMTISYDERKIIITWKPPTPNETVSADAPCRRARSDHCSRTSPTTSTTRRRDSG